MAVYYVSNAGNDSNDGLTTGTSWQTITKVNSISYNAGDQILFNKGDTFYGTINIARSGSAGNLITYGSYGAGNNPVITGFTTISSWTNLGSNIWESTNAISTLSTCNIVTIDGTNTSMGRYPKANDTNGGYLTFQTSTATSITSSSLTGTPDWTGASIAIKSNTFTLKRALITSQSTNTLNFASLTTAPLAGYGFFFTNDIRCCTQQNEWYYNPATKKLSIYSTSQPSNVNIATIDYLVNITANYVKIDGITFTGANLCGVFTWSNTNTATISNCIFINIGLSAIYARINNITIENNTISQCNSNAMSVLYVVNPIIRNNIIHDIGLLPAMKYILADPLSQANATIELHNSTNCLVEYNSLTNVGYTGIVAYDSIIQYNFIDTFCTIQEDGGGIYGSRNSTIYKNIVLNGIGNSNGVANRLPAAGIYLDQGSHDVEISYNTVANCYKYGFFIASLGNVNSHHNTAYNCSEIQLRSVYWGYPNTEPSTTDQINNNILVSRVRDTDSYDSYQICLGFYYLNHSYNSNDNPGVILASTSLNNNYYARPIADTKTIFLNVPNWVDCWRTLEEWQTLSGKDQNSHKSSQTISDINDFQFEYNNTLSDRIVSLLQPMIDITGIKYSTSITLTPFSSVVLMKDANPGSSVPTTPLNVSGIAGNTTATISFDPPLSDGGSTITSYTAISTPGNISSSSINSPITISGLTNGISYTFIVYATNSVGNSANSLPSNSVTPTSNPGLLPKLITYQGKSVIFTNKRIIIYL